MTMAMCSNKNSDATTFKMQWIGKRHKKEKQQQKLPKSNSVVECCVQCCQSVETVQVNFVLQLFRKHFFIFSFDISWFVDVFLLNSFCSVGLERNFFVPQRQSFCAVFFGMNSALNRVVHTPFISVDSFFSFIKIKSNLLSTTKKKTRTGLKVMILLLLLLSGNNQPVV